MNLKSIKLDNQAYHEYLQGKEIHCAPGSMGTKEIAQGEHVLVFKDTVTASTAIAPPKSEMQSEYIGIEGKVTGVNTQDAEKPGIQIKKI